MQAGSNVGQFDSVCERRPFGQAESHDRQYHVPRAGHVIDFAGTRSEMPAVTVRVKQQHSLAVEFDDDGLRGAGAAQLFGGKLRTMRPIDRYSGRGLGRGTIRNEQRGILVAAVIGIRRIEMYYEGGALQYNSPEVAAATHGAG